ncbi:GTP-binding protein Di-Ras2-like [Corticium candelabrum]|uniref:GTP-binding protein Di-Ras2-like n=1 Tax=Corticium candelabrum TaxID=121492 RepID=UPI002E26C607|nr:GTP-binding protein Di-Ras2-like [Corticium candelabrum]
MNGRRDAAVYRLAVLGATRVGKSSLIRQWIFHEFSREHVPTVEERHRHSFKCGESGILSSLVVIDTGGDQQFPAMQQLYMKEAQVFLLVFSVDSRASLEEAGKLRDKIIAARGGQSHSPVILVASKVDLPCSKWEISDDEISDVSVEWDCPLVLASAKKNLRVDDMFGTALKLCKEYVGCPSMNDKKDNEKKWKSKNKSNCSLM